MPNESGQPIGSARIDIHANTAPLKQEMEAAKSEVKVAAEQVQAAANNATSGPSGAAGSSAGTAGVNEALKEQAKNIRDNVGGALSLERVLFRLAGATSLVAAALVGAAVGLARLGTWLVHVGIESETTARKLEDPLLKTLEKIQKAKLPYLNFTALQEDATANLKKIREEIDRLTQVDASRKGTEADPFVDKRLEALRKQEKDILARIFEAEKRANEAKQQAARDQERFERTKSLDNREQAGADAEVAARKRARDAGEQEQADIQKLKDQVAIASENGSDKILAERQVALDEIQRQEDATSDQLSIKNLEKEKYLIIQKYAFELQMYYKTEDEKDADKKRRYREDIGAFNSSISGQAASQFDASGIVLGALNQINSTLEIIASQRRGEVL